MLTIDFETEGIVGNPIYNPPKPVGVSIKLDAHSSHYWSWGHPSNNNCTLVDAKRQLMLLLKHADKGDGWLAHNAPFECAVLRKYFGYAPKDPLKVHDTQYLLFLTDPYAFSFSLKPSAERVLGVKPEEQDRLKTWILAHMPGAKNSDWGAYICHGPGDLVGEYACGDTDRTYALYTHLMKTVLREGMLEAYRREQKLMPILSDSSLRGVRLDMAQLSTDIPIYREALRRADDYIISRLGNFNIDSDAEFADALDRAGMVTDWVLTPTGRRSTSRKNLAGRVRDPVLLAYVGYRGVLSTCLGTFAEPWYAQGQNEGGRVHPQWNQVRGDKGVDGDMSGTRTGRMSCRGPNLQNPPNDFSGLVVPDAIRDWMVKELTPVPHMRKYLLPEPGQVWLKRDFSAQEMRIMAHFAEGKLYDSFRKDAATDPHVAVQRIIADNSGIVLDRKYVKITGFGIMYGRGIPNLAAALGVSVEEGKATRDAYFAAMPEVRELSYETRNRGRRNEAITTWGGRKYYREPDLARDLSYKLMNYLIQGSAADQTKQSIIDWHAHKGKDDHLIAAVHDEINISAPTLDCKDAMKTLREQMNLPRFDVPFLSEGYIGANWADLKGYE